MNRSIEKLGGVQTGQKGSHRHYTASAGSVIVRTTVAQHRGDMPRGTLRAIERDMEPVFGKGWLTQ